MQRQRMSVGFADLRRYQKLIETLGDEKAIELLQAALEAAGDAVIKHGGQIRKYIGDAFLFTCPTPPAAIGAAQAIAAYRREAGGLTLRYVVAVATGEVLVTPLGHPSFMTEDILGETVNRAAKLLQQAVQSETGLAWCDETRKYLP